MENEDAFRVSYDMGGTDVLEVVITFLLVIPGILNAVDYINNVQLVNLIFAMLLRNFWIKLMLIYSHSLFIRSISPVEYVYDMEEPHF